MKRSLYGFAVLLCAMVTALGNAPLHAQAVTTGSVAGRVTGAAGAAVAGAEITATNERTGARVRAVSSQDGRYLLSGVQPGVYRIEVQALGFASQTRASVDIALGQSVRQDFALTTQAVALEALEVTAERGALFSRARTGVATTLGDSALQRLPTLTRNLADYTRLVPQISTAGEASNAAGRNSRFNNIQIDGAVNNDVFGLASSGTPGGQANARPITLEAIQELQVVIAPFDVRQGGFTGAGINAITKSGTNRFTGSASYFTRGQNLVGRYLITTPDSSYLSRETGAFNQNEFGASLGGPIVRDRLHFFVAGEGVRREFPTGFTSGFAQAAENTRVAQTSRVAEILRTQYGYDPGEVNEITLGRESDNLFGRLDWNINQNHRFTLRHNYVDAFEDNLSRSATAYNLGNAGYSFTSTTNSTVGQLNSTFAGRAFNEFRVGYSRIRDQRSTGTPFPRVSVRGITCPGTNCTVLAGTENFSGRNKLDQDVFEVTNDITFALGRHNVVVGTRNEFFQFSNLFVRNPFGTYVFADTTALKAGRPIDYEYSYRCRPNLRGCSIEGQESAEFPVRQLAFYAQDQFDLTENFTLTAGLRYDVTYLPQKPSQNDLVTATFNRRTDEVPSGNGLWNPRVGFNWDVAGRGDTQLRGGVGLFSGRTPYVWISNAYGNTGMDYVRFRCNTVTATASNVPDFVADPNNQPTSCRLAPGQTQAFAPNEINLADPALNLPQVLRTSFALDQRLPWQLVATLEGLYSQGRNDPVYQNLAIQQRSDSILGRPRWQRIPGIPGSIGDVYDVTNTSRNYSYSLTTQLQRAFDFGLSLSGAYNYAQAWDVNPLRSSQAVSNFRFNPIRDNPNDPDLRPSDWLVEHRFLINGALRTEFVRRAPTEFSFVLERESGRPYSYRYQGDVNGDGADGNDLVYVPRNPGEIRFVGTATQQEASWNALNAFIEGVDCLREARGTVVERNACRQPWSNRFDARISQVVPTVRGQRASVALDILNFANLLNSRWGRSEFISNQSEILLTRSSTSTASSAVFNTFNPGLQQFRTADLGSRYQLQLSLRYAF